MPLLNPGLSESQVQALIAGAVAPSGSASFDPATGSIQSLIVNGRVTDVQYIGVGRYGIVADIAEKVVTALSTGEFPAIFKYGDGELRCYSISSNIVTGEIIYTLTDSITIAVIVSGDTP